VDHRAILEHREPWVRAANLDHVRTLRDRKTIMELNEETGSVIFSTDETKPDFCLEMRDADGELRLIPVYCESMTIRGTGLGPVIGSGQVLVGRTVLLDEKKKLRVTMTDRGYVLYDLATEPPPLSSLHVMELRG
jgi:hypothetical protein